MLNVETNGRRLFDRWESGAARIVSGFPLLPSHHTSIVLWFPLFLPHQGHQAAHVLRANRAVAVPPRCKAQSHTSSVFLNVHACSLGVDCEALRGEALKMLQVRCSIIVNNRPLFIFICLYLSAVHGFLLISVVFPN